jgi:hypothetical protein
MTLHALTWVFIDNKVAHPAALNMLHSSGNWIVSGNREFSSSHIIFKAQLEIGTASTTTLATDTKPVGLQFLKHSWKIGQQHPSRGLRGPFSHQCLNSN